MNKSVNVFLKIELYTFHALIEWLYLNKPVTGKKKKRVGVEKDSSFGQAEG